MHNAQSLLIHGERGKENADEQIYKDDPLNRYILCWWLWLTLAIFLAQLLLAHYLIVQMLSLDYSEPFQLTNFFQYQRRLRVNPNILHLGYLKSPEDQNRLFLLIYFFVLRN